MARPDPTTTTVYYNDSPSASPSLDDKDKDYEKAGVVTEVVAASDQPAPNTQLHRNLKSRHLQMIAIGTTIGTGLFVGSGSTLHKGGPLGLWLGYSIMGAIVFSMVTALGEMVTLFPMPGAHMHFAGRFVDPSLGFALGWNSWWSGALALPTEMSAAAVVVQYWSAVADVNVAAWIAIMTVAACSFNLCGVRYFGEAEFWFSVIKVTTLIGLLILGVIITCGGGPTHEPIGFRYWRDPGPFQQENGIPGSAGQFLAFWTTFTSAAYAYLGTEGVAMAAAEAADPRRNVPKAIRRVFWRIATFYIFGTFLMGLLVSPNNASLLSGVGAAKSPWVIAITEAGIKGLPSVINAVVLTSAWSSGNASLYNASRVLYGLANDGRAPRVFRRTTKRGVPLWALVVTIALAPLGFMSCGSGSAANAFTQLSNLTSISGLLGWGIILFTYLRFHYACKKKGLRREEFAYRAPLQPYLSYWGLTMICLIVLFNGYTCFLSGLWDTTDFVMDYIGIPILLVFFAVWKIVKKTKFVRLAEMDLDTGRREIDRLTEECEAARAALGPQVWYKRVWDAVM